MPRREKSKTTPEPAAQNFGWLKNSDSSMNTEQLRKHSNPIHLAPLFRWILVFFVLAGYGLIFVYVKNQQHQLGQATRDVERQTVEIGLVNEVLAARITTLSSRAELMRKLDQGVIDLAPIQDTSIARLLPPTSGDGDQILRTASNERLIQ